MAVKVDAKWRWNAAAWTLAIFLFYLLSIGPAARLDVEYPARVPIGPIYWPLCQSARYEPIGKMLASYINLWMPSDGSVRAIPHWEYGIALQVSGDINFYVPNSNVR